MLKHNECVPRFRRARRRHRSGAPLGHSVRQERPFEAQASACCADLYIRPRSPSSRRSIASPPPPPETQAGWDSTNSAGIGQTSVPSMFPHVACFHPPKPPQQPWFLDFASKATPIFRPCWHLLDLWASSLPRDHSHLNQPLHMGFAFPLIFLSILESGYPSKRKRQPRKNADLCLKHPPSTWSVVVSLGLTFASRGSRRSPPGTSPARTPRVAGRGARPVAQQVPRAAGATDSRLVWAAWFSAECISDGLPKLPKLGSWAVWAVWLILDGCICWLNQAEPLKLGGWT